MLEIMLTTFLASSLYLTSSAFAPQASTSHVTFTQVLPEKNFVSYTVKEHDTLATIATKYYGADRYWTTLWNDNPEVADPENVEKDRLLKIRAQKPTEPEVLNPELSNRNSDLSEKRNAEYLKSIGYGATTTPSVTLPVVTTVPTSVVASAPSSSFEDVYKEAGAKYGVPWQVLYGLHKTESGGRDGAISSGGGPQGPMQFMPGTWNAYGVDGNGDGTADINNARDAIHGAANFLAKHGSLDSGLRSYGGNTTGTLNYARQMGYAQ